MQMKPSLEVQLHLHQKKLVSNDYKLTTTSVFYTLLVASMNITS